MNDEELILYNQQLARLQGELSSEKMAGPSLIVGDISTQLAEQFCFTGAYLNLATRYIQMHAPIIRHDDCLFPDPLTDLYLPPDQLPFSFNATPWDAPELDGTPLVSFTHIIRQIYGLADNPTPLPEFMGAFNPLISVTSEGNPLHSDCLDFTSPELSEHGFAVSRISASGTTLRVCFAWIFRKDRKVRPVVNYLPAGTLFLHTDSGDVLGDGEWLEEEGGYGLLPLLQEWLEDWCDDDFAKLFSQAGRDRLEDKLFWANGVKSPRRQDREKRVAFVREHPELWDDHDALAKALQDAGLYSKKTNRLDISTACSDLIKETMG